jgi:hypothetical protein
MMHLDVGSGTVKGYDHGRNPLNHSIFINGNLARVLLGWSRLGGNATHREEGLRWCDSLVTEQVQIPTAVRPDLTGGYWGVGYPMSRPIRDGELYLGDSGTAVTTLAQCVWESHDDDVRRSAYLGAMRRYDIFVRDGCPSAGCGASWRGAAATTGFVNASAGRAIGCGYYKGHLSTCPYVVATATTGAAFMAELANVLTTSSPAVASAAEVLATDAVRYMASLVSSSNGSIPYVIDCQQPDWVDWPLDTLSYVTEGVVAAWLHVPKLRDFIIAEFKPTAEWLIRQQNADGSWGSSSHGADRQRSPRVSSLLALFVTDAAARGGAPDPRYVGALAKFVHFLSAQPPGGDYGLEDILNTSGFVGLALLEMLSFGVTFGPSKGAGQDALP